MKKLMQRIMLSCLKAAELIEKKQLAKLNGLEKAQLAIHTSMCDACKAWESQSIKIGNTIASTVQSSSVDSKELDKKTIDDLNKRILEKINKPE